MIRLIRSENEFISIETELSARIDRGILLPGMVFRNNISEFVFIEFDNIFDDDFFYCIMHMGDCNSILNFVVIDPDPRDYFYHYFGCFGAIRMTAADSYEAYMEALKEDPGESPADALIHNSSTVVMWNSSLPWTIYGDRSLGVAIVGFETLESREDFVERVNVPVFDSEEAVDQLISASFPNGAVPGAYRNGIINNYGSE